MDPSKPIRTFIFVSVTLFKWDVLQIKVFDFSYQPQKLKLFFQSPSNTKKTKFKDRSIKIRVGNRNTGSDRKKGRYERVLFKQTYCYLCPGTRVLCDINLACLSQIVTDICGG